MSEQGRHEHELTELLNRIAFKLERIHDDARQFRQEVRKSIIVLTALAQHTLEAVVFGSGDAVPPELIARIKAVTAQAQAEQTNFTAFIAANTPPVPETPGTST